jgi:magnesium transporter
MSSAVNEYIKRVTYRKDERVALLRSLSVAEQSTILQSVSSYIQQQVLHEFTNQEVIDVLDHMDLQSAQKLVVRIRDLKRREKIVSQLKADIKDKMEYFLRFHPKATFSLVHFNYVFIPADTTIGETGEIIEAHYEETGKFPEILVHEAGMLMGEVPIGVLVRERNKATLEKFTQPVTTITYQAEVGEIIETLTSSGKRKVVVLDHDGSVLGVIYADDAIELFGHLPAESLYSLMGVDSSERPLDGAMKKFRSRWFWLVVNLATCFLASGVIVLYEDTINTLTVLAVYLPMVAGMGGNAASQTFAVILRGITMGSVTIGHVWPVIYREFLAALLNGMVIGVVVAIGAILWHSSPLLGLVVAMSMVGQHVLAACSATVVPLTLKSFGKDPGATSMIFITTVTDIGGFLLVLSLGTWLLM